MKIPDLDVAILDHWATLDAEDCSYHLIGIAALNQLSLERQLMRTGMALTKAVHDLVVALEGWGVDRRAMERTNHPAGIFEDAITDISILLAHVPFETSHQMIAAYERVDDIQKQLQPLLEALPAVILEHAATDARLDFWCCVQCDDRLRTWIVNRYCRRVA